LQAAEEKAVDTNLAFALAERLENWFMAYKEIWRRTGKTNY